MNQSVSGAVDMKCFFFGCWNGAGHFAHRPGGYRCTFDFYGAGIWIDSNLAPRTRGGRTCWSGQGATNEGRIEIGHASAEFPQGYFLRHEILCAGDKYTAISWWDRCQGDTRDGSNSTVLLEGEHTASEMIAALHKHFPHVAANLERAGVKLVEVRVDGSVAFSDTRGPGEISMINQSNEEKAREALAACTADERRTLFREFSLCVCAAAAGIALRRPATLLGAFLGGVLGYAIDSDNIAKKVLDGHKKTV